MANGGITPRSKVTGTNLFVLGELADAVDFYGAPISQFSSTAMSHLRRLAAFGLIEQKIKGKRPAWDVSASGEQALEEIGFVWLSDETDPERRERRILSAQTQFRP